MDTRKIIALKHQALKKVANNRWGNLEILSGDRRVAATIGHIWNSIVRFPMDVVAFPFVVAYKVIDSADRGYGVPEFISKLSYSSIFVVATLGTLDVAWGVGKNVISPRKCRICKGWQAMQCTTCKGSGQVKYQVKNYNLKRGEKATAECISDAIVDNRAELVHIPHAMDLDLPLPYKDCPSCDATGVMGCPECKGKFPLRFSAEKIMEPPWVAADLMTKMDYPYEHIVHSMKDPSIAAFWLISMPQIIGGFNFDDDVKQKIWWQYKESRRYDQLRDEVAMRKPGWEYLQEALISIDPERAKEDPVVVKNIPFHKAKSVLEAEVMKINPPPRPQNWGDLDLPLSESSWSKDDLKDPKKVDEMKVLLNAQREIAGQILDTQWETKWRQEKLNEMLKEKVMPYIKNIDKGAVLCQPIIVPPKRETKRERRWWLF
jgi:hypothetical protein